MAAQEPVSQAGRPPSTSAAKPRIRMRAGRNCPQQPSVEFSLQGLAWLNEKMGHAFNLHGKLPLEVLAKLDWPIPPS